MMKILRGLFAASAVAALCSPTAGYADGDLSRLNVQEIVFEMGTANGRMFFKPDPLELRTGQAYKLVLTNTDDKKHEFIGPEFIEKIFTRKVEVATASGDLLTEIKGNITEVEVGPGQKVEWFIVPVQTGTDIEVMCVIEGHYEAGMHSKITIK